MENNNLTRFDVKGQTHELSALGGIPQGQSANGSQNLVESGETKMGNFVYSDRITLDSNRVKQFNLPGYAANKSVSAASKAIEDKFKDRNDKYASETKKTLLDRLANAQESVKAEQEQTKQSMQTNSQQAPEDMMGGQVPEGMEEFVQPQESQPMAAYGGMQRKYEDGGYIQGDANLDGIVDGLDTPGTDGMTGKQIAGGVVGGLGTALQLGQTAFGKAAQDVTGTQASDRVSGVGMIGGSAVKGASAGAAFGPLGAGIGAAVGGLAGLAGLGKARKAEALNTQRFATNTNRGLSDNYAAYGGNLNIYKYADGGIIDDGKKKDIRQSGQTLVINPISELGHTIPRNIPTNMGKMQYSKSNDTEYNNARKDFTNWYSDPATATKFAKNTGYDPNRLYDMTSKAVSTPSYKGDAYKQPPVGAKAIFNTPDVNGKKEEIIYHGGIGSGPIQHELTHAGAMANIIGPALMRTLGSPKNQKLPSNVNDPNFKSTSNSAKEYLSIPEEAYGNFHEFRVNLGLKPGQNVDRETLRKLVKDKGLQNENFYNTFEDDKIVDAINKIAYTGNNNANINMAAYGGNLNVNKFVKGGELPTFTTSQLQQTIGLQPGVWGPKSINALKTWQKGNGLVADGIAGPATYKQAGLMDGNGRYQFKRPNIVDTSNEVITTPINNISSDVPTQTLAGFEKYAEGKLPTTTNQKINNALKYVGENAGEALRYAPIAANLLQMKNLKKPTGVQYQTLGNRYKPSYVDEAQGRNIVDAEGNNTIAAISQSGASQGATRNAILGAGLNKTKALSDVYANAAAQNRVQDAQAQQFNANIDQSNVATANKAIDEMRMDDAAYRGAKSKMIANLGNSAGAIGKEIADSQLASALTGYTRKGKYLYKPDGTKVTPEEMTKLQSTTKTKPTLKKGDEYIDESGVVKTFKYGGYLNTKRNK